MTATLHGGTPARWASPAGCWGRWLAGFLVLVVVVLTGCSTVTASGPSAPAGGPGTPSSSTPGPLPSTDKHLTPHDPRTIIGPGQVQLSKTLAPVSERPQQRLPSTVTDSTGRRVTIRDASRVLLLDIYGTYSQIAIGLGLDHVLVGRTSSDTQPELAGLPLVTRNGHELNAEAILALSPSVVVTDTTLGPPEVIGQLRRSGVVVVTLTSQRSMDTVGTSITTLATILGVPQAGQELSRRAEADIAAARREIATMAPREPLRMSVLYMRGTAGVFFIFGSSYGTGALITGIGGDDIASRQGIKDLRPANAESLVSLDPEVIIVMSKGLESAHGVPGLLARPGVAQTTAGRRQRIIAVPDNLLLSFGPNTGNLLRDLAAVIYRP